VNDLLLKMSEINKILDEKGNLLGLGMGGGHVDKNDEKFTEINYKLLDLRKENKDIHKLIADQGKNIDK
jgi:hypothetical protein